MAEKVERWITVKGNHIPVFEGETPKQAIEKFTKNQSRVNADEDKKTRQIEANKKQAQEKNGNKEVTEDEVVKKLVDNSYIDNPEYKKLHDQVSSAFQRGQETGEKLKEIKEKLKLESSPKPKEEWDFDDEFASMIGERPMKYTEAGKKLKSEYDKLYKEHREADHEWSEASEKLRQLDAEQSRIQKQGNFDYGGIARATKDNYEGFEKAHTTTPYIDQMIKEGKADIIEMSPQRYLKEIAHNIFEDATIETAVRGTSLSNVNKYIKMMKEGVKFNTPYLNYKDKEQEGRHRAIAAMMLGIEKIPVVVIRR